MGVGLNGLRMFVNIRDALLLDSGRSAEESGAKEDEGGGGRTSVGPENDWCSMLEAGVGSGE